jgi:ATP-dependent DNA ligase
MEAEPVEELPSGDGWQYEPKYDGFRCLAHVSSGRVHLQSKNRKPLERYFPEVVSGLAGLSETDFVLDGELVITTGGFEALQLRLHPAESRIRKLSDQTPAQLVAFDLLEVSGSSLIDRPLAERRPALAAFVDKAGSTPALRLGEATEKESVARGWLGRQGLDGIVAKRLDGRYLPGERAMRKFKLWKTVDCVVGGLYLKSGSQAVEHLLLGSTTRRAGSTMSGAPAYPRMQSRSGDCSSPWSGAWASPAGRPEVRAAGRVRSACRCHCSRPSWSR